MFSPKEIVFMKRDLLWLLTHHHVDWSWSFSNWRLFCFSAFVWG